MKQILKLAGPFIFYCVATLFINAVHAQNGSAGKDTMYLYYNKLLKSGQSSDTSLLIAKMYELLQTNDEQQWINAQNFFFQLGKKQTVDSIRIAEKTTFPRGAAVREEAAEKIYAEKDPVKKESMYLRWKVQFPPSGSGSDDISYDYVSNDVATTYAARGNVSKAVKYANMVKTPVWKGEGWAGPARELVKGKHYAEAEVLLKKALNNSLKYKTTNRQDPGADFAAAGYPGYNQMLGQLYMAQHKFKEALPYAKFAYDSSDQSTEYVSATYAQVLRALHQDEQAFKVLTATVVAGAAGAAMKDSLKTLYNEIRKDGSYQGFSDSLNRVFAKNVRDNIGKQMIDVPTHDFSLKDIDDRTVSLSDYKGKIIILDFWATWCGPCKASFPAMKNAVENFSQDSSVVFLFIHTWERDSNATGNAKKFIAANQYPFRVLMDLKDSATGTNKVVEQFKVDGIPTKFIIDQQGHIRFRFTGFSGGNEAAVEEISAMVEYLKKNARPA